MNKFNLKKEETEHVKTFVDSTIGALLNEYSNWGFSIGDILVRYRKNPDNTQEIDKVSRSCPIPKKYRVIHIDSTGTPWVKQMSVRGGLGKKLCCLAFMEPHKWHFKVDPELIEAQLLGFTYDPRREYKQMRNERPEYGKNKNKRHS